MIGKWLGIVLVDVLRFMLLFVEEKELSLL